MTNSISKVLLCGLGLASLTNDAIQKAAEDLVKQCKISEREGKRLVIDLKQRSKQARTGLEKTVDAVVHKAFQTLNPVAIINNLLERAQPVAKVVKKTPRRAAAARKNSAR